MKKIIKVDIKIPLIVKLSLLCVIFIRIILLFQPSFKIDMNDWQAWAARLVEVGPFNFYSANFFADYFPFFYLCLFILTKIFVFIFGKAAIFSIGFEIYIKIISNIFDILTTVIIFKIINNYSRKWAFLGSVLYLFNPSVIFNSSVWGQIDAIPTFLLTYSLYQLEEKRNIIKSLSISVLSFLIKPLNISLFPIMFIRIVKNFTYKIFFKALGISLFVFLIATIAFFPKDVIFGPIKHLFNSLNVYPYTSINAYNFWAIFGWWKSDAVLFFNLSLHVWGYIFYTFVILLILFPYLKNKSKIETKIDYFACALSSFGFYLFLTRMHERHLFPVFTLLIIAACVFKSRTLIVGYVILAIINFINVFYSYYYYNVVYDSPIIQKNIIFDIASNYQLFFTILSLIVFVIMFVVYFKKSELFIKK